ncbi:MAG: histidinol-phosphatase [Treponema sp.]|nr:histidinol-phosphatase [Treponema sp.]
MPFACIHTHTTFCDGADDIETCCRTAFGKGLQSLGFSAHAPITRKTGLPSEWHLSDERLPEYINEVRAARKRWEGKLPVYLGLEVDFVNGLMGPSDRDYREMDLDYIIASVHYVIPPKGEPFTVDDSAENVDRGIREGFGGDPLAMVNAYYEAETAMIGEGGFDVLGHPDLVKKNNTGQRLFREDSEFYLAKIAAITALIAGRGVPAEINTGGINRGKTKDCYPSAGFLVMLRKQNVPMVINADAHRAQDLDGHYEEARKALLAAGYTRTVLFEGKKDGHALWRSIGI